jgi:predicted DNA-binding transcriptional regulator AlpA
MSNANTQQLPSTGYVRMAQIAGPIVPVCAATIWRWVRAKKFPQPVKLSERVTAFRAEEIRAWLDEQKVAA